MNRAGRVLERLRRGLGEARAAKTSRSRPFSRSPCNQSTLSPFHMLFVVYIDVFIVFSGLFEFHGDLVFLFFLKVALGSYKSIVQCL